MWLVGDKGVHMLSFCERRVITKPCGFGETQKPAIPLVSGFVMLKFSY